MGRRSAGAALREAEDDAVLGVVADELPGRLDAQDERAAPVASTPRRSGGEVPNVVADLVRKGGQAGGGGGVRRPSTRPLRKVSQRRLHE